MEALIQPSTMHPDNASPGVVRKDIEAITNAWDKFARERKLKTVKQCKIQQHVALRHAPQITDEEAKQRKKQWLLTQRRDYGSMDLSTGSTSQPARRSH